MTREEMESHLKEAYWCAARSPDTSNQNGAVLVDRGNSRIVKTSCNRFPYGWKETERDHQRPRKYNLIVHAEMGAVLGITALGMTLVCPWAACSMCARCIVESGVSNLVVHQERMDMTPERWREDVILGEEILTAGGVRIHSLQGKLGLPLTIKVNGEDWQP
ncbi:MAG: hypothetical protein NXI32_09245 [bacterium]|nr:hypothetical protein [bacterium]